MKKISEKELMDLEDDGDEIFGGDGKRLQISKVMPEKVQAKTNKFGAFLGNLYGAIYDLISEEKETRSVLEKIVAAVGRLQPTNREQTAMTVDFEIHRDTRGYIKKITATRRGK